MNKYAELKNQIMNKFFSPIYETNSEIINAGDIIEILKNDMELLKKVRIIIKAIEKKENKKSTLTKLKNKVNYKKNLQDDITLDVESLYETSKVIIKSADNVVCICRDINTSELFFQSERGNDKKQYEMAKKILFKYSREISEVLDILDYYALKYETGITLDHFIYRIEKKFNIQTIMDDVFIIDIFIDKNFEVDYKVRFAKEIDPNNLLEQDLVRSIPLIYYIDNNKEDFIKRFYIPQEDLDSRVKASIIDRKQKIK